MSLWLGNNLLFPSAGAMLSFCKYQCPSVHHCWLLLSNKNSDCSTHYVGTYFGVTGVNNVSGSQSHAKILSILSFLLIIFVPFFSGAVCETSSISLYIYVKLHLCAKNKWMC